MASRMLKTGVVRWGLVLGLAGGAMGCVAAAAAAGAGAGVYLTSRGAESLVNAPVEEAAQRAGMAFTSMEIAQTGESTENSGTVRELKGKKGDLDVTVQMEQKDSVTTRVEVTARKNAVEWDKDFAKQVLQKIVSPG